ncbi:PREDICTED: sodium bicarbonate transporter-like protein 11 [Priapulus caudatus]|uniref:Sodium bicarbonate transporter-like protein 11 n=1 Tax=Priapulus caudatus TaxID=37621 RepID=A0ABM1DR16_PRICU|nr:PREDICTED: sodium bicarbonate transporter-like protein 11 [Priapulus caudatus]XP_014662387.1 PREDICTED: sodium bicarbonate transporter-like protein 11 [Priapulus caudatus]
MDEQYSTDDIELTTVDDVGDGPTDGYYGEDNPSSDSFNDADHRNDSTVVYVPSGRSVRVDAGNGKTSDGAHEMIHLEVPKVERDDTVSTISGVNYTQSENTDDIDSEVRRVRLMYANHETMMPKDFNVEVEAVRDTHKLLDSTVILLDQPASDLNHIVSTILHQLLDKVEPSCSFDEAKSALFTHDAARVLAKTVQGLGGSGDQFLGGSFDYDQSWICTFCNLPCLQKRHVAIARLRHPTNLGRTSQEVNFFILLLAPSKEKGAKTALDTCRVFASIFAYVDFRLQLHDAENEDEFRGALKEMTTKLGTLDPQSLHSLLSIRSEEQKDMSSGMCPIGQGLLGDIKRRLPHYLSDYKDGVVGHKTIHKLLATTFFLYFSCILPSIAFGVLNDYNTNGKISLHRVVVAQAIGGLFFHMTAGQPLVVLLTTAPLALYMKVIYNISKQFDVEFYDMYACVGFFNSFFLILFSLFNGSNIIIKWSTRSTEEIFALFISIAFSVDAFRAIAKDFSLHYTCKNATDALVNTTVNSTEAMVEAGTCLREVSILYVLLTLGTLWLGVSLFNFTKTPFLNANKREVMADYALPIAVIVMTFVGSYLFRAVPLPDFNYAATNIFQPVTFNTLTWPTLALSCVLGFSLSLLFFMDQNISAAMVNAPEHRLKKGSAYHLDLLVIALLNLFFSVFGLPWMHGALPHSPLHVRALADIEERVDQGHICQIIVRVRETRLTGVLSHILIALSLLLLPHPIAYIPQAVLDGLFLYMAVTALNGNQMYERMLLLVQEQSAYPPNHYLRRVPKKKVHIFTLLQVLQLLVICGFGFARWPYLKMGFPVVILLLLPIRHLLIPKVIEEKYLTAMDYTTNH